MTRRQQKKLDHLLASERNLVNKDLDTVISNILVSIIGIGEFVVVGLVITGLLYTVSKLANILVDYIL